MIRFTRDAGDFKKGMVRLLAASVENAFIQAGDAIDASVTDADMFALERPAFPPAMYVDPSNGMPVSFHVLMLRAFGAPLTGRDGDDDAPAFRAIFDFYTRFPGKTNLDFTGVRFARFETNQVLNKPFNADKFGQVNGGAGRYSIKDGVTAIRISCEGDNTQPYGVRAVAVLDGAGGIDRLEVVKGTEERECYDALPTVLITGGGGTGADFTPILDTRGFVTGFTKNDAGSGYAAVPSVSVRKFPYSQSLCVIFNFRLIGPGNFSNVSAKGIVFNQPTGTLQNDPGPSRVKVRDVYVSGMQRGYEFHNHSYCVQIDGGETRNNIVGFMRRYGSANSGERLTIRGNSIFGNVINFDTDDTGGDAADAQGSFFNFEDCSGDYSQIGFRIRNGCKVAVTGESHLEGDPKKLFGNVDAVVQIEDKGSQFHMRGGQIVWPGAAGEESQRQLAAFVRNEVPVGTTPSVIFEGVTEFGNQTTSNMLSIGPGLTVRRNCVIKEGRYSPPISSLAANRWNDYLPARSDFVNVVQITRDGAQNNWVNSCAFRGYIAGNTLTVLDTPAPMGTLAIGQTLSCPTAIPGTRIVGGAGLSWTVDIPQNVGSAGAPINMVSTLLHLDPLTSPSSLSRIENLGGSGVAPYPDVAALVAGIGNRNSDGTFNTSVAGPYLQVSGVDPVTPYVVQPLVVVGTTLQTGPAAGAKIIGFVAGVNGGPGVYRLDTSMAVAAGTPMSTGGLFSRLYRVTRRGANDLRGHFLVNVDDQGAWGMRTFIRKSVPNQLDIVPEYAITRPVGNQGYERVDLEVLAQGAAIPVTSGSNRWVEVISSTLGRLTAAGAGLAGANRFGFRWGAAAFPDGASFDVCGTWMGP